MSSLLSKQSSLNSKSRCRVLICLHSFVYTEWRAPFNLILTGVRSLDFLHSCVCIEWHAPFSLVLFVMSRSTCKKAEHGEVAGLFIPSSFVFIFFPFLPQCFQWWFNGYIFFLLHKQKCWGSQCLSKASIANLESLSGFSLFFKFLYQKEPTENVPDLLCGSHEFYFRYSVYATFYIAVYH